MWRISVLVWAILVSCSRCSSLPLTTVGGWMSIHLQVPFSVSICWYTTVCLIDHGSDPLRPWRSGYRRLKQISNGTQPTQKEKRTVLSTYDPRYIADARPSKVLIGFACFETKGQNVVCKGRKYVVCYEYRFDVVKAYEKMAPWIFLRKNACELQLAHLEHHSGEK